ncbi:heterokaryon incompatibility protein-domain-containing protein [Microdochium trichocladiopsis]|uniref:Heterokaryon incompatibility protein-domain-containing protein n=1 Tax=Microdochium trichocladiopsis TaxID=1682393 RepID=A0A9P8YD14_9PEZI|nr:heterokaryon incompatibility protein-domain-containing protein [Microdochium trichocladiopsis]KAH7037083.1 heterokaryon incompatibility protein-domain-containing protein [Microdochium trichocladiopsis]
MPGDLTPLQYAPLSKGEARLLYATSSGSEIEWTLKPARLLRGPGEPPLEFDALSYTWGDFERAALLRINDEALHVHHNLNEALPYFVPRLNGRPIWIDAICINQQGDDDKTQQIALMAHIYRRAQVVWAWLGYHDDAVHKLLDKIVAVAAQMTDDGTQIPRWELSQLEGEPTPSWYKRLWVVQEVHSRSNQSEHRWIR